MKAFQLFCNFSPRFAQRQPSFRKVKKEMGGKGVSDERLSTRNIFLNFRGQVVRQGREEMKKIVEEIGVFFHSVLGRGILSRYPVSLPGR